MTVVSNWSSLRASLIRSPQRNSGKRALGIILQRECAGKVGPRSATLISRSILRPNPLEGRVCMSAPTRQEASRPLREVRQPHRPRRRGCSHSANNPGPLCNLRAASVLPMRCPVHEAKNAGPRIGPDCSRTATGLLSITEQTFKPAAAVTVAACSFGPVPGVPRWPMSINPLRRETGRGHAPHMSPVTPAEDARTIMINQVSWGAVLAGVVMALVTQLVLNMLGIGIGAATLDPATGDNPSATSLSIGAGVVVHVVRYPCCACRRLCGGPACRSAKRVDSRLAWSDNLGPLYSRHLLPSDVDGRRHSRWGLSHYDERPRQRGEHGWRDGADSGAGRCAQSPSGHRSFLLHRAVPAWRYGRQRPGSPTGRRGCRHAGSRHRK